MVYGCVVYTVRAGTAAVPCSTRHVTHKLRCKYNTSVETQKRAIKIYSHSLRIIWDKNAVRGLESGE